MRTYSVGRTDEEIDKVMNEAAEQRDKGGSRWPGMSYEEGVLAALEWIFAGPKDDFQNPMED